MRQPENTHGEGKKGAPELKILAEKASKGDGDALYELCEKIAKDILFRARFIMGNQTDAEDVTQEVLFRLCKNIRKLRDTNVFGAWLGKIIANEAKRHMAENTRRGVVLNIEDHLEAIMEEKDDFLPQNSSENEECRRAVVEIISELPMRQREAVIFHYYDGLSVTDTAEAMSVTWQCVSRHLALAREKIRHGLEKRRFGAEKFGGIAALPIGSILSGTLQQEAQMYIPANQEWMQQTLAQCGGYIQANPFSVTTVTAKSPFWLVTSVAATVLTMAAAVLGVTLSDMSRTSTEIPVDGKVLFSGGIDYGADIVYVNPTRAEPGTGGISEDITATQWWITRAGDETVLYSGEGRVIEDALPQLLESGEEGEYMLFFRMESADGKTYKLRSNFYILVDFGETG